MDHVSPANTLYNIEILCVVRYVTEWHPILFIRFNLLLVSFFGCFWIFMCVLRFHISVEDEEGSRKDWEYGHENKVLEEELKEFAGAEFLLLYEEIVLGVTTFRKRSANLGWCVPSCNMSVLYMVALRSLLRRSCMVLPISQISSSTSSNSLCSQDLASFHSTALLEHVQAVVWLALRFQRRREATPFGKACILSTARLPRYLTLAQRRLK